MTLAPTPSNPDSPNPFLSLNYEPALEALGDDYFDEVAAAEFPEHILRFRNDALLPTLGLDPQHVQDCDFIAAFGKFRLLRPLLALRYHGYQFGYYNPDLGDGRGFLCGQVRGIDGELYDFGTKGSGRTPYSRGGDGRLTLKGGFREVLASEALHQMSVRTSRCLSLIETGEALWRGDEPSPTRASVMVRMSRSHIRFGTFERLFYLQRPDLIKKLLDHVIKYYYPHLWSQVNRYHLFYAELVKRVAEMTAQWMAAGFCHGVLNTDNMSITGESFDYGPYAFIPTYNPGFTAAYFDYEGRYAYGRQPGVCKWNLEMLQIPLDTVIATDDMEAALVMFDEHYHAEYKQLMLKKLGFAGIEEPELDNLLKTTIQLLQESQFGYHDFFFKLRQSFSFRWQEDINSMLIDLDISLPNSSRPYLQDWCHLYHLILNKLATNEMNNIKNQLTQSNPKTVLLRPVIETSWEPIVQEDNWQLFYELLSRVQSGD